MSETAEQAATRRRWISLAELVAVSGLIIGALTLWMNWSDKREEAQEKAATSAAAGAAQARFALDATLVEDGKQVRLTDPRHELLESTITFPKSLGVEQQNPATARIERGWFADAVLKATDGGADSREGRLPVLVTARYRVGEAMREGRAVVEIVWRTEGHLMRGRSLSIEAVRVREPGGSTKRIDALWADEMKRQSARA
jgi:type II secretory pathway pseudopilin PulG